MWGNVKAASPIKTVLIKDSSKEMLLLIYTIVKHPPIQVKAVKITVEV